MATNDISTTTLQLRPLGPLMRSLSEGPSPQAITRYPCQYSMGIFYHDKELSDSFLVRQIKIHLNKIFLHNQTFNHILNFSKYLTGNLKAKKIFFIICSNQPKSVSGIALKRPQCAGTYILTPDDQMTESASSDVQEKVMKYLTERFEAIWTDVYKFECSVNSQRASSGHLVHEINRESLLLYVFYSNAAERSFRLLSSESLKFLLYQTYTKVLIGTEHEEEALDDMLVWCRSIYEHDRSELENIEEFQEYYQPHGAIYYYTRPSFVFRQVNRIFRLEDLELIFKFRSYITDLYRQIMGGNQGTSPFSMQLFRGAKLSNTVIQQLFDNLEKHISINGFMSTTKDIDVAKMYAGVGVAQEGHESAIFQLNINTNVERHNSFADIEENSEIRDDVEVLFTMGSVWLLRNMEWTDGYWLIELEPCNTLNTQLSQLESLTNGHTFLSMGHIAYELREYSSAKNFYQRALNDEQINNETRGHVYYYMGLLDNELGEYMNALENFLRAERFTAIPTEYDNSQASDTRPMYSSNTHPSRLQILNNTGRSYEKKGDFKNARQFYTKALGEPGVIGEKSIVYYNLGLLEYRLGKYPLARRYFTEVLKAGPGTKIFQDSQKKLQMINDMTPVAQ